MSVYVGIDAGGTLVKLAYWKDGQLTFSKMPSTEAQSILDELRQEVNGEAICITGGKADWFAKDLPPATKRMVEFEATTLGVRELLGAQNPMVSSFVLTNIGTGTSIHYLDEHTSERATGIGLGGGTLMGLSAMLTGVHRYEDIVEGSLRGKRGAIDLTVQDIYVDAVPPIPGELTASNFGKAWSNREAAQKKDDQLAAITGMIGESIVTISAQIAVQYSTNDIVYIGSTLSSQSSLKQVCSSYTKIRNKIPHFIEQGEFSGALGALLAVANSDVSQIRKDLKNRWILR
ncbi:type II pantothenate kinase [Aureibacillus halotolerans]|uniref:Pantothenate kinase n=1 Tax=Aureibacillus halotolerans TaxID=1508390 RepID=A0A4R6TVQ1_9BACI|nr:type II pantothenate kinase [Aureibacillus halotolerans]TDQ36762.1 pantothenate kinase [Aureibacillus halotolerans]